MRTRTRIRWKNVARLAAAAVACAALVVGLPALLERPKPPPLPDDIGLAQAGETPPLVPPPKAPEPRHAARDARPEGHRPEQRHGRPAPKPPLHQKADRDRDRTARAPVSSTVASSAPPAPTPPATPTSPPAYVPPAPAPAAASSPSPPASSSPAGGATQAGGPSEFGFER